MKKPRLVHITTTDISLALLLGPQLRAFRAAGFEVIGVSAPGDFVPELEADGIRHVALRNATRSMAPHRDGLALIELYRILRELRPDIVHTHNPKPGVYGRLAAKAAGVRAIVNTVHGLYALPDDRLLKRSVVYGLERLAASVSHAELLQNVEDLPVLKSIGINAAKLSVLGNGIDLDRFQAPMGEADVAALRTSMGASDGDILVGVVGRLVWEKGYREVFAAAQQLATSKPNVRIAVVGPYDFDKHDSITQADIDRAQVSGNLCFLGHRGDVEMLYPAFDCYVLASYREGFPRSAMEAAAAGCPLIVSDIRGGRQVVDHEVNGLLIPAKSASALVEAIERIAGDADLRRKMATASICKANAEFDQRRVIAHTLATYNRLLERTRPVA